MSNYITAHAAIRYDRFAQLSGEREVGGYAKFHVDEHGNVIVTDLRVLRQKATSVTFEISAEENGLFLEKLVGEGEDPKDWGMLFHTHPEGMDARMSGPDVAMLNEMAKDLPGTVVRSMILGQGKLLPMIHEAVYVDGRVFTREDQRMKILDTTGAEDELKAIGWFDKPKVVTPPKRQTTGYTPGYAAAGRAAANDRPRELASGSGWSGGFGFGNDRDFDESEGWYDKGHSAARSKADEMVDAYAEYLDAKHEDEKTTYLIEPISDPRDDEAEEFIGCDVMYGTERVTIVDAYAWDGDITLILSKGGEVGLDEVTMIPEHEQAAS